MIKIQGQYTLEDFKNAQKLHLKGRRGTLTGFPAYFVAMAALTFVVWAISSTFMSRVDWPVILIPFGFLMAVGIYLMIMRPRQIARVFQQQKELSAPLEIELSEDGFKLSHQYGSVTIPWKDFAKWKEDQDLILLYRSDLAFTMLPKRFLAGGDQLQYVHDLLTQAGVPDAYKIRTGNRRWRVLIYVLLFIVICVMIYFNLRPSQ
jgi:uncharacterized integral membrane protein